MPPTRLLNTWVTIEQAQRAAGLDDLLRCLVLGDGGDWDEIPKITNAISLEVLYDMVVRETVGLFLALFTVITLIL